MLGKQRKSLLILLFVCLFTAALCASGLAQVPQQVKPQTPISEKAEKIVPIPSIGVTMMDAQPKTYSGKCPTTITFKAHIAAVGVISPGKPVTVKYTFTRSDGATGPVETVTFTQQGAKTVTSTWSLGSPGATVSGWKSIRIISPYPKESDKRAEFTINCSNEQ